VTAYYNEFDTFAAAWLRKLIHEGLIADGEVDERSIVDVAAADLRGFTQVHFFAGIGGWSYALRLAGWPDDRAVWTGSYPCQPFSAAGRRKGTADKRHLWPEFRRLIGDAAPAVVFGEQVASKDGRLWLAGVRADLEALGYGVGAADISAAGVGAPHIRQRLWWVADAQRDTGDARRLADESGEGAGAPTAGSRAEFGRRGLLGGRLANTDGGLAGDRGLQSGGQHGQQQEDGRAGERLGDADHARPQGRRIDAGEHADQRSPWQAGELLQCADGKARRVEPGIFPLAHGVSARVGTLRGAGNAIVPQVAAEFIQAYCEIR